MTGVPDSSECPQNQRRCGSGEVPDVFDIADNAGLIPKEQAIHNAISASFAPDEKRPHDTAHANFDAEYGMTEGISPSGCDTGIDGVDELPAQDMDMDTVEQQSKDDELEPHMSTPDLGSESMVPSPLCAPNSSLSPELSPARMAVVSTRIVPQQVNHELESSSIAAAALEAVTVTEQNQRVSLTSQFEGAMDEETEGDVYMSALSFPGRSSQVPITTDSSLLSTDENSHLSPKTAKSTKSDMTLMPMLETVTSSSITWKKSTQISTAERITQEPLSNVSPAALPACQNVPSMCNPYKTGLNIFMIYIDIFGNRMRILALRRGLSNSKTTLRFDILEDQLQGLEIWNNRGNTNLREWVYIFERCPAIHRAFPVMIFQKSARGPVRLASLLHMGERCPKDR